MQNMSRSSENGVSHRDRGSSRSKNAIARNQIALLYIVDVNAPVKGRSSELVLRTRKKKYAKGTRGEKSNLHER